MTSIREWTPSRQLINTSGFIICSLLLAYAYYLEFFRNLPPCPLCTLQRLAMTALGVMFLLAAVHNPNRWGKRIYASLIALFAMIGASIAGRHAWLQYLAPEEVSSCLPGLDYLLDTFPVIETLQLVLLESGACSGIDWTFVGLSIPVWTLIAFIVLGMVGTLYNWMGKNDER